MNEIFDKLIKAKITPNSYYVLYCCIEKRVPDTFVSYALEIKKLQSNNLIDKNFELTEK